LATLNRKDRHQIKDFERMLREESIIEEDESLVYIMEEATFNDTIGKIEDVMDLSSPHTRHVISVNSIDMYTVINNYKWSILLEPTEVNTKYKMVDK
jgi:hypothetical protein